MNDSQPHKTVDGEPISFWFTLLQRVKKEEKKKSFVPLYLQYANSKLLCFLLAGFASAENMWQQQQPPQQQRPQQKKHWNKQINIKASARNRCSAHSALRWSRCARPAVMWSSSCPAATAVPFSEAAFAFMDFLPHICVSCSRFGRGGGEGGNKKIKKKNPTKQKTGCLFMVVIRFIATAVLTPRASGSGHKETIYDGGAGRLDGVLGVKWEREQMELRNWHQSNFLQFFFISHAVEEMLGREFVWMALFENISIFSSWGQTFIEF